MDGYVLPTSTMPVASHKDFQILFINIQKA